MVTTGKRREWIIPTLLLPIALAFLIAPSVLRVQAEERLHDDWDDGTGEATVDLTGTLEGHTYRLSSRAKLYTDAQDEATTMEVWAQRLSLPVGRNSKTPIMNVYFDNLRCSAVRSYTWQQENGSFVKLACDRYVLLADLPNVGIGRVDSQ